MYLMRMMRRRICRSRMSCSRRRRRGRRVPGRRRPGHGIQSQDWSVIRRRSIIGGMVCKITSDSCSSCRMKIMMMMWMFTHSVKEDVDVIRRDDGGCRTRWSWSVHNNDKGEGLWWDIFYSSKQTKITSKKFLQQNLAAGLHQDRLPTETKRFKCIFKCNTTIERKKLQYLFLVPSPCDKTLLQWLSLEVQEGGTRNFSCFFIQRQCQLQQHEQQPPPSPSVRTWIDGTDLSRVLQTFSSGPPPRFARTTTTVSGRDFSAWEKGSIVPPTHQLFSKSFVMFFFSPWIHV